LKIREEKEPMPARKPIALIDPKIAKTAREDRQAREADEAALIPAKPLTEKPPSALKGKDHTYARAVWKRLIRLYQGVDGTIVTAFDQDLLVQFCQVAQELAWWGDKRAELDVNIGRLNEKILDIKDNGELFKALELLGAMNTRLQGFDARLDGKRKLLHSLAQSLYLTPRARAGVAPSPKEPNVPDPFGDMFD
jgi:hypothetical protein